jgi:hypothetical protein
MTKTVLKPAMQHGEDAITLLTEDHKKVKKLFADFAKLAKGDGSDKAKAEVVRQICRELTIHAQVEEEIFYPAVRAAIKDNDLMDEADVEHAGAKNLIAQLEAMTPAHDHYDATVTVLGEIIDHHVGRRGKNVSQGKESQGRHRRSRCSIDPTQARVAGGERRSRAGQGQEGPSALSIANIASCFVSPPAS